MFGNDSFEYFWIEIEVWINNGSFFVNYNLDYFLLKDRSIYSVYLY